MENAVLHVSILTMVAVTLERFNALCRPFKLRVSYTIASAIKTIVGIWVIGCSLTVPFLIMSEHEDARFFDGTPIKVCRTKVQENWRYCYIILIVVLFFAIPFFILVAIYSLIIRQLTSDTLKSLTRNDSTVNVNRLRSRKQVVHMLVVIIALFFVSLFPIRVVTLWLIFTPTEDITKIGLEGYLNLISWARILMYINSAGNPIIYSLNSTKFKMAFNSVLRRNVQYRHRSTMSTRCIFNQNARRPDNVASTPLELRNPIQSKYSDRLITCGKSSTSGSTKYKVTMNVGKN